MSELHQMAVEVGAAVLLLEHMIGKTRFRSLIGFMEVLILALAMVALGIILRGKNAGSND